MNVLVIDDKKSVRDFVRKLLVACGCSVETAVNGLDGFEKAQQGDYQLFVIDHRMPLMNGVLLSKNIKQNQSCSSTPILFMTTQSKESLLDLPEFALFEQVLAKPLIESEFLSVVAQLLPEIHLSKTLSTENASSIAL